MPPKPSRAPKESQDYKGSDLSVALRPIEALVPYARNARTHSEAQVAQIAASIVEFGWTNPVLADERGIVAGHGRVLAARQLYAAGKTIRTPAGKELPPGTVPVIDCTGWDEDRRRAYVLADNQLALNAGWDLDLLKIEVGALAEAGFGLDLIGFEKSFLDELLAPEANPGLTDPDDAPPVPIDPVSKPGDLWVLGGHRVLCGSSLSIDDVTRLCGGQLVDMWLTDPPYNVAYEGGTKAKLKIANDDMGDDEFRQFLRDAYSAAHAVMKPGAVFYIWHADSEGYNFRGAARDVGWVVRQCLIWKKSSLVLGRQDYQWQHEPCQPPGTMVRTPTGEVAIEALKDGDRVVSYNSYSSVITGMRDGRAIKVASRHYDGQLYGVRAGGRQTWTTDSHRFSVRFSANAGTQYCTYLMRRGDWWRVGITSTYNARGFGLKHRIRQERADEAWIISVHQDKLEAVVAEHILSAKYGIPQTHWEVERGFTTRTHAFRSADLIEKIYAGLDLVALRAGAHSLLKDYGRRPDIPFVHRSNQTQKCSRRVTVQVAACNIIPGLMEVPIPYATWDTTSGRTFEWQAVEVVNLKDYAGPVYSLDVERDEHYVADGIVTHNCLYGWKDGAGHLWAADRKQTTILEFDKPARNGEHPTMKPVALFEYQMLNNTKGGDVVLDSFGGSGTTVIACEKNGRIARTMELDPAYVDVIVRRWEEFTGQDATLDGDGRTFKEVFTERKAPAAPAPKRKRG